MSNFGPAYGYRNLEEFEREVLRSGKKAGWSLDDLYSEASFNPGRDDSFGGDGDGDELDFG